jgi:hypothetical protein
LNTVPNRFTLFGELRNSSGVMYPAFSAATAVIVLNVDAGGNGHMARSRCTLRGLRSNVRISERLPRV